MLTGNTRIGDEIGETHLEYVSASPGIVVMVWVEAWILVLAWWIYFCVFSRTESEIDNALKPATARGLIRRKNSIAPAVSQPMSRESFS